MSWATGHIERLRRGETVAFNPKGHSMRGRVEHGERVVVRPLGDDAVLAPGDIVLCRVRGRDYLHLVKAIRGAAERTRYLIGNNRGGLNGWISRANIFGLLAEDSAQKGSPTGWASSPGSSNTPS